MFRDFIFVLKIKSSTTCSTAGEDADDDGDWLNDDEDGDLVPDFIDPDTAACL